MAVAAKAKAVVGEKLAWGPYHQVSIQAHQLGGEDSGWQGASKKRGAEERCSELRASRLLFLPPDSPPSL